MTGRRSVLVVGGAGFIGSHLVEALLDRGDAVTVIDSFFLGDPANLPEVGDERLVVVREDATDAIAVGSVVARRQPSTVFNLATKPLLYSFVNPPGAFSVNTQIATVLAELLRGGAFQRLVQFSSSEVYGSARVVPMTEDHPYEAHTPYAAGKAAADLLLASYVTTFDLDVVTIRPFNNYGPRQSSGDLGAVVPVTIRRILDGKAPYLEGGGSQTRDFSFVDDTVQNAVAIADHPEASGQVFNLGTGEEVAISTIVEAVCSALDYSGPIEQRPSRPGDVARHLADTTRARSLVGKLALTPLGRGIVETVEWYRRRDGR